MPERVKNVVNDANLRSRSVQVDVPASARNEVQLVIDRRPFEKLFDKNERHVIRCELYDANDPDAYLGGCTWGGGEVGPHGQQRRGQRMIWSFARWPIPKGVRRIRIELTAPKAMNCKMDVDFF